MCALTLTNRFSQIVCPRPIQVTACKFWRSNCANSCSRLTTSNSYFFAVECDTFLSSTSANRAYATIYFSMKRI